MPKLLIIEASPRGDARLEWWSLKVPEREMSSLQEKLLQFGWLLRPGDSFADPWGIALRFARQT